MLGDLSLLAGAAANLSQGLADACSAVSKSAPCLAFVSSPLPLATSSKVLHSMCNPGRLTPEQQTMQRNFYHLITAQPMLLVISDRLWG